MRKRVILLFMVLLIIPSVLAINLEVEKPDSNEVIIAGINKPAVYDLEITNLGLADNFRFDNLLGFSMFPIGTIQISEGETEKIQLISSCCLGSNFQSSASIFSSICCSFLTPKSAVVK